MSHSLQKGEPAASANKVPTIQTVRADMKRSVSYTIPAQGDAEPTSPTSSSATKIDQTGCNQMLKASLTGLLNAGEVKTDARGRRVQNLLLETERDLRRQRRQSLGEHRSKAFEAFKNQALKTD